MDVMKLAEALNSHEKIELLEALKWQLALDLSEIEGAIAPVPARDLWHKMDHSLWMNKTPEDRARSMGPLTVVNAKCLVDKFMPDSPRGDYLQTIKRLRTIAETQYALLAYGILTGLI